MNRVGWELYADFRPEVDGWGKRGQVTCDRILDLRKKKRSGDDDHEKTFAGEMKREEKGGTDMKTKPYCRASETEDLKAGVEAKPPEATRSVEEYEAALEDFDADELDALP